MQNTKEAITVHQVMCNATRTKFKEYGILGPWMDEPDRVEFKAHGLDCLLVRHVAMFHWCGYVGVGKNHPKYGLSYDDVNVDVHGGLTYAQEDDNLFWFGFDCAHAYDLTPGMELHRKTIPNWPVREPIPGHEDNYRDVNFVIEETTNLARQLSEMT